MAPEIQPRDEAAARRAMVWMVGAAAVMGVTVAGALTWIEQLQWMARAGEPAAALEGFRMLVGWFAVALAGACVVLGVWGWRIGSATVRDGRWPPNGMQVIRETRVLRGRDAEVVGRVLLNRALAVALLGIAAAIVLVTLALSLTLA